MMEAVKWSGGQLVLLHRRKGTVGDAGCEDKPFGQKACSGSQAQHPEGVGLDKNNTAPALAGPRNLSG